MELEIESRLDKCLNNCRIELMKQRTEKGWTGKLSSSALSTATAITAFKLIQNKTNDADLSRYIESGMNWLAENQNKDGGWGDSIRSNSNISTSTLCRAAFQLCDTDNKYPDIRKSVDSYLEQNIGSLDPGSISQAIYKCYGKDRTFAVTILTMMVLSAGACTKSDWKHIKQLPFELAALPQALFRFLRLPVVSYALPALIAIGYVRHFHCPGILAPLRWILKKRCMRMLEKIQPSNGGFLEASPLTSFVAMSLAATDMIDSPVVEKSVSFLKSSMDKDGSWPIDSNLATWVTTLSVNALALDPDYEQQLPKESQEQIAENLLNQQYSERHAYTGAAPGAWSWTHLPGAVPDADDTAGALLALSFLYHPDTKRKRQSAQAGIQWLLDLQNSDGGIPTFCKGWTKLPFDQSSCDISAHVIRAFLAWQDELPGLAGEINKSIDRMLVYLQRNQESDGRWLPLWFGNENLEAVNNPVYGTAKVMLALAELDDTRSLEILNAASAWLIAQQNDDGGWGGSKGIASSLEETGLALEALAALANAEQMRQAMDKGLMWVDGQLESEKGFMATPLGFYFANLWYFEELYPVIFLLAALARMKRQGITNV